MQQTTPAILALALVAAVPAGAAEFIPGWTSETIWSSNVFRSLDEDSFGRTVPKEDDFSLRTGPNIRFREAQGDLTYDLRYTLRYEEFVRLNGISEFDHSMNANLEWHVTDRTTLSLSDNFADAASLNGVFETFGSQADLTVRGDRTRVKTNTAYASARHSLGPLWEMTLSGEHSLYEYEADNASDSSAFSGSIQLTRGITRRLVLGMGGTAQRQEFEGVDGGDGDGSTFFQAFGIMNYRFSRTLRLAASAGPALSMPDEVASNGQAEIPEYGPFDVSTCPRREDGTPYVPVGQIFGANVDGPQCQIQTVADPRPGGGRLDVPFTRDTAPVPFLGDTGIQDSLTYFARVSLDKEWRLWRGSMTYSRSASSGSGLGVSTLVDSFLTQLTWTPTALWTFNLSGILTMQTAISETREQLVAVRAENRTFFVFGVPTPVSVAIPIEVTSGDKIDNPIDIKTYRIELRADRRITRNLTANGSASWYQQTSSGQLQDNTRTEYRLMVGLTWNFDAIPL